MIQKSEITSVIYGYKDPNPLVAGIGHKALLESGIETMHLPLGEIDAFYRSYSYWHKTGLPWVTAKLALSLDGKIAGENGKRVAITGPQLKEHTYLFRKTSDALLTTAKTILCDDPELKAFCESKPIYILDRTCTVSPAYKIWQNSAPITVFYSSGTPSKELVGRGVRFIKACNLASIFEQIGKDGIHDLWVEAGGKFFASLLEAKALHEVYLYLAPKWLGNKAQLAFQTDDALAFEEFTQIKWYQIASDAVCHMKITGI